MRVGRLEAAALPAPLNDYEAQVRRLLATVGGAGNAPAVPVTFAHDADGLPEGYALDVSGHAVQVRAAGSRGALHAARTLVDLWDARADGHLPKVRVADHPTFPVRGLFAESFAGTDRMELADWKQLVDRLGQLKLNTLGVSIYGCWQLGHGGQRTEFLFLPLRDFPLLRTPQQVVTWDPDREAETEVRYLPRMFDEDFFGEVVRYAASQGIEVIPHLGGPGHSSLLPRLVPDLSAVDDTGRPTGYGYCMSRPEARSALSGLVRCLATQHLVPAGVRRLHVAGDEYYPIRNVDPQDPQRVVSPYCQCAGCRGLTPGQLLVAYLVQVGKVLAEHDVAMVHWQDTLVREGVLDAYLDQAKAEGLPEPVIAWWKYNDPVPTPDASRAETWVCPTTGLFSQLFHQDFTPNIETALRRGHRAGAAGTLAYTLPRPADHPNVACLADLSWNLEGAAGANGFWERWTGVVCPDDLDGARHALSTARTVTACYPLMTYVADHVLPYFSTAAAGVTAYPDDLLRAFAVPQPGLADVLRQVRDTMRDAVATMPPGRAVRGWPDPAESWRRQCARLADTLDLFLDVLAAAREPDVADARRADLEHRGRQLMRRVRETTPPYLAPSVLREHWTFVREIGPALERLRGDAGVAGAESWYAWIV